MVKFIATDLDGTLLDENSNIPDGFSEVIEKLNSLGIQFAIASGRQYDTICEQFKEYTDKITVIAENGAVVYENGERIVCDPLDSDAVEKLLNIVIDEHGLFPIACGIHGAIGKPGELKKEITKYYTKYRTSDALIEEAKKDDILKIAIFDYDISENHCYKLLEHLKYDYNILISGRHWLDIMKKGVTKGSAIEHIQKLHGYSSKECMAFGDFMNDADMMRVCYESYAVANAHPDLKSICRYVTCSNKDNGVIKTIKDVLF